MSRLLSLLCAAAVLVAVGGVTVAVKADDGPIDVRQKLMKANGAAAELGSAAGIGVLADAKSTIEERIRLMKVDGQAAKLGLDMIKGTVPFDLAKAKGIFATFVDAAQKEKSLFPPDSKTGGTTASPKVWEDMAGFLAAYDKFGSESAAAQKSITDLDSFKAAFGTVTKNCGGCHETYRVKRG
ncbi:Cytochrome c556 [Rhizobiales bacterium GAS188]|nr:Cytochrome c556 [Rhizobiales bacterium GAS188]